MIGHLVSLDLVARGRSDEVAKQWKPRELRVCVRSIS